jgi:hypothetical protein
MAELLDVLCLVTARLDTVGVPYMVTGSLALGYYAQPRMTRDIDIVVELEHADIAALVAAFARDFYCDEDAVRRAVETRRLVNLMHLESAYKIDFIIRKDSDYRRVEFERRRRVLVEGFEIWIVTPEDLLLSKLVWSLRGDSALQRRDVASLVAAVQPLDWTYIERWGEQLGVGEMLRELRR